MSPPESCRPGGPILLWRGGRGEPRRAFMNVLVTGATGFVGAAVARALLRQQHRVVGLVRDPGKAEELRRLGMTVQAGDMWKPETYQHLPSQVDAVVHAAQSRVPGRFSRSNVRQMHESDALMTRTLAKGCLEQ